MRMITKELVDRLDFNAIELPEHPLSIDGWAFRVLKAADALLLTHARTAGSALVIRQFVYTAGEWQACDNMPECDRNVMHAAIEATRMIEAIIAQSEHA